MATNKNTPPNVVGEPFKEYVNGQIKVRQQAHGSGFKSIRSDKDLVYLNSRNAWVKMASSVDVLGPEFRPSVEIEGDDLDEAIEKQDELVQAGVKKLQELGLDPNLTGNQLAKKAILFNGTSEFGNKTQPGGVASNNSIFNNSAYGFGGSDFGLQPMPGITSFVIGHNNIGSIRTATVNIRAHSPLQFGIINLLYIRLGYNMIVEWGNSLYLDNNGKLQKMGPTLIDEVWFREGSGITPNEFNTKTEEKREQYNGNYDGFFGKVVNFEYKFNTDGSYDIELKLISQGDVIESFRLDSLSPEFALVDNENSTEETELDQTNLLNALYCFDPEDNELARVFSGSLGGDELGDLVSNEEEKLEKDELKDILSSEGGDLVNPYAKDKYWIGAVKGTLYNRYYLRFGYFLEFLKKLLPIKITKETKYPELEFNVSLKNYSKNYKDLLSFDPDVCFINNGPEAGFDDRIFGDFKRYNISGNPFVGTLMNIYIEGKFIEKTVKNLMDSQDKVTVFTLLEAICNGINRSLADVTALYPSLQDDYMVVIRDANLEVRTGKEGTIIDKKIVSETIELFGYNTSTETPQSTFVKDFDFTTTISKELSSMISIGATAGNTDVSEYSGFFANLNKGLEDRFKTSNETIAERKPLSDSCPRKKKTAKQLKIEEARKRQNRNSKLKNAKKERAIVFGKDEDLTELWKKWREKYLDEKTRGLIFGNESYLPYFSSNENEVPWERGRRLFISILKNKGNIKEDSNLPKNVTSSNIGFIPMGVDLTLEGIGGMRVYNQLKVNGQYLPVGYPDELELVIIGLDHQVQDNSWVTKVRTYTKPSSEPYKLGMEESVVKVNPIGALAEEEITTFTQEDPNDDINRRPWGVERYDASALAFYLKSESQQNGLLEDKYLSPIPGGFKLAKSAAFQYILWHNELKSKGLAVTLTSAYRPLSVQNRLSATSTEPGRVAEAGTSAHGWGGAIDLAPFSTQSNTTNPTTNLAVRQTDLWKEVASIGAKYGWYNPKRLSDKAGVDEAWHFEYWVSENVNESPTIEDIKLTETQKVTAQRLKRRSQASYEAYIRRINLMKE